MILDNYETIVSNIVKYIRNGVIVSNNSEKLDNKTPKELFIAFTEEFNLNFHKLRITSGLYLNDNILGIPIPQNCVYINELYFNGIGKVNIHSNLLENKSDQNFIYFDLNTLQISKSLITPYIVIDIGYVSYKD